jgi:hypothetical protein
MSKLIHYFGGVFGAVGVLKINSNAKPDRLGYSNVWESYNGLNTDIPTVLAD